MNLKKFIFILDGILFLLIISNMVSNANSLQQSFIDRTPWSSNSPESAPFGEEFIIPLRNSTLRNVTIPSIAIASTRICLYWASNISQITCSTVGTINATHAMANFSQNLSQNKKYILASDNSGSNQNIQYNLDALSYWISPQEYLKYLNYTVEVKLNWNSGTPTWNANLSGWTQIISVGLDIHQPENPQDDRLSLNITNIDIVFGTDFINLTLTHAGNLTWREWYLDGSLVQNDTNLTYSYTGLTNNTQYNLTIKSYANSTIFVINSTLETTDQSVQDTTQSDASCEELTTAVNDMIQNLIIGLIWIILVYMGCYYMVGRSQWIGLILLLLAVPIDLYFYGVFSAISYIGIFFIFSIVGKIGVAYVSFFK